MIGYSCQIPQYPLVGLCREIVGDLRFRRINEGIYSTHEYYRFDSKRDCLVKSSGYPVWVCRGIAGDLTLPRG